MSVVTNGRITITQTTLSGCTATQQGESHDHYLFKHGEVHEHSSGGELVYTFDCPGRPSMICTYTLRVHEVDGTLQYYSSDFICEDA